MEGEHRGVADALCGLEATALDDDLELGMLGGVLQLDELVAHILVVLVVKHSDVEHHVDLVGATFAGEGHVGHLHGGEGLRGGEASGHHADVDTLHVEVGLHHFGEV